MIFQTLLSLNYEYYTGASRRLRQKKCESTDKMKMFSTKGLIGCSKLPLSTKGSQSFFWNFFYLIILLFISSYTKMFLRNFINYMEIPLLLNLNLNFPPTFFLWFISTGSKLIKKWFFKLTYLWTVINAREFLVDRGSAGRIMRKKVTTGHIRR